MLRLAPNVDSSILVSKYNFNEIDGSCVSFVPNKEHDDLRIDVVGCDGNKVYVGSGFMLYSDHDKDLELLVDTLYTMIEDKIIERVVE